MSGLSCILLLRREEMGCVCDSGGVGGQESTGLLGVCCKGGVAGEGWADSFGDSCWLGEVDEVLEVVELLGTW